MLNGVLALHDVHDVERLAQRVLNDWRRHHPGAILEQHDTDDCISYLIATAWELSLRYNPDRKWSFSKYAYRLMRARIADWYRQRHWDTRAPKPEPALSFDRGWDDTNTGGGRDRLERALQESSPRNDLPSSLEGLLTRADRRAARLVNESRQQRNQDDQTRDHRLRLGQRSAA